MMFKINQYSSFTYQGGLLLFAFSAAVLIAVSAHPASFLSRLLEFKPLKWIGECSYGIYLWHFPVIVLTSPVVNTTGVNLSLVLAQVSLTMILVIISRYFVEDPIRYGHFQATLPWPRWWSKGISKAIAGFIVVIAVFLPVPAMEKSGQTMAFDRSIQDTVLIRAESLVTFGGNLTVIGDSIVQGAEPILSERVNGLVIDAKQNRQLRQAKEVVRELEGSGQLAKVVVIALGTNGPFSDNQLIELLESLENAEKVVFVNTRVPKPWESTVNETYERILKDYRHAVLIDWYAESSGRNEYFYNDGVHLTPLGAEAYSSLIINAV
jgi:lysophospholipase L1-like esterase